MQKILTRIYDDFFAEVFVKNAEENPVYQREGGDWINSLKYQIRTLNSHDTIRDLRRKVILSILVMTKRKAL